MKKLLSSLFIAALVIPTVTFAKSTVPIEQIQNAIGPVTTQVQTVNGVATIVSPRTGIQYSIPNEHQRPVVLQTQAIAAANSVNANRIVASNPALSSDSQQIAKKALIEMSK